jgi:hypothetical protein
VANRKGEIDGADENHSLGDRIQSVTAVNRLDALRYWPREGCDADRRGDSAPSLDNGAALVNYQQC